MRTNICMSTERLPVRRLRAVSAATRLASALPASGGSGNVFSVDERLQTQFGTSSTRVPSARQHPEATPQPPLGIWLGIGVGLLIGLLGASSTLAQPSNLTVTPMSSSVSLGAAAAFRVAAYGAPPFTYQWWFTNTLGERPINGDSNPSARENLLELTGIQTADSGSYYAVVTDASNLSATSLVATLTVDPTFTKITSGDLVNTICPVNDFVRAFWADYDGDGDVDVSVHFYSLSGSPGTPVVFFYRNEGDGTFVNLPDHPLAEVSEAISSVAWADFDQDGDLDLLSSRPQICRQMSGGALESLEPLFPDSSRYGSDTADWVDVDNDGWLDLFIGRFAVSGMTTNLLFHNQGNGTFTQVTTGVLVTDRVVYTQDSAWADFDNDGRIDLVAEYGDGVSSHPYYHNEGGGVFRKVANALPNSRWGSLTYADFDNDGDFDLFNVGWTGGYRFFLNQGYGTFRGNTGQLQLPTRDLYNGVSWGDYDNDGWLDVAIATSGGLLLYRNNADGRFASFHAGSPANDPGYTTWCSWVDINGDGFLDLFVGTSGLDKYRMSQRLYLANPTTNHWLAVQPFGTRSSRTPVGAKVRAAAILNPGLDPEPTWQLRQISASGMIISSYGDGHVAHFGLGQATNVQTLRIEWPSGAVQELTDVAANQRLTVWEPPTLSVAIRTDRACDVNVRAEPNRPWQIQTSADLRSWQTLTNFNCAVVGFQFVDTAATGLDCRFYRVKSE